MKIDKIIFATSNKAKAKETERILNVPLEVSVVEIDEIQGDNLEAIALNKLNQAFEKVGKPVIIDDVSVEIDSWGGFPGPLVKWVLDKNHSSAELLLKMLKGEENRSATAKLAIGFHDGKVPHLFIGEIKGKIAEEIMGENGFGWDPVFIPEGQAKTFAQMSVEEKDAISHRRRALDKLSVFLKANYDI